MMEMKILFWILLRFLTDKQSKIVNRKSKILMAPLLRHYHEVNKSRSSGSGFFADVESMGRMEKDFDMARQLWASAPNEIHRFENITGGF